MPLNKIVDDDNNGGLKQKPSSKSSTFNNNTPGRRLKNPLGYFSSYSYQLSLYMITPDAYDAFVQSGRRQINALTNIEGNSISGALLIAQSGGINNTDSRRAPGFDLDYYIDNLSLKTFANPKANLSETNTTEVKFQIIEPYGFSFITKLKNASEEIQRYSQELANGAYLITNPSKQFFVLGIRFLGYDENGNVMTGDAIYNKNQLDPEATNLGLFDRYYDILITGIKFKIDGNATTYNITAVSTAPKVAFGVKRGMIKTNTTIEATKVEDALNQLVEQQNKLEEDLLNQENPAITHANKYVIEYAGEGADAIKTADIVTPEDYLTYTWAASQTQNTTESNVSTEANSQPNNTKRQIIFKNDTPMVQAISKVISQSTYLSNALQKVYDNVPQPETDGSGYDQDDSRQPQTISWYNLSARVSDAVWDKLRNDFAYTITYVIKKYETPVVQSVYADNGILYYGPHKRYEYWYTGQNSEIISYEQNLDNLYYNVALSDLPIDRTEPAAANSNAGSEAMTQSNYTDKQGQINEAGLAAQNNYLTSLFDPGAFATAKITILGDPDYLAQDSPGGVDEIYSKFYGSDGFTINPSGGQVFIEIDFKEAIDLDYSKGYLDINDRILFWKYPESIADQIKGVSYQVIDIYSTFQGGTFKQVLNCVINTFGDYPNERPNQREEQEDNTNTGSGTVTEPTVPRQTGTSNTTNTTQVDRQQSRTED